ncbi:ABC transporter ATP-binding protein [Ochrobactrum sp. Marseille-Q0166]|uniref:ABC transporter ATP-binding protein n=1 Tax=Ochrobactrum sp. Marseille-Q0166 TaxID=2761105 RepID=UPI00165639B6|nr:ABC transporter ATP-binding protein [Ochrobactrum sp. Marseille-Q0166]MBC8716381.1 ABC transporter ATP-binding protein [Ochrobactrum sp. Marseille-Q0166]
MTRVILENIDKIYAGRHGAAGPHAVRGINLTIGSGQLVTLLGPSGCGKTTTLRMLAGFETPTSGRIFIDDQDITNKPVNQRGIGMVFQSYALFPHMSVRENISFGLNVQQLSRDEIHSRVEDVMDIMALRRFADNAPAQLSGGQQQRVALARTVVTRPRVLLFDEPLSNLDAQLRERMRDELRMLQQRLGITSLYVTHDQNEAMAISDRVIVMNGGVIEQDDAPTNIYARPATAFVAEFMGKANILKAAVETTEEDRPGVRIGGAMLQLDWPGHTLRAGETIDCVIRPEQISIDPTGPVETSVERVVYQGAYVEYGVSIDGQPCNVIDYRYHANGIRSPGETLRLGFGASTPWPLGPTKRHVHT